MKTSTELPIILFKSAQEWESWLNEHHSTSPGVWVQIAKKGAGVESVSYAEAVDVALCYGWIDGQKRSLDDKFSLQKFTRRGPKSVWSKINTQKVKDLIVQGRMQPPGLKQVEAAKQDGRWDAAYDSQRTMKVPEDFQAELDKNPEAKAFFATLNSANRYAFCRRILMVKKPETRRAKIAQYIAMLNEHKKFFP